MSKTLFFMVFRAFAILTPFACFAQEDKQIDVEASAEVFLEAYSDEFQDTFFEALKQKGIENYDKAINLLLKCKQMDQTNKVLDHELAKIYLLAKQYVPAKQYAISALNAEPSNKWYLDTLLEAVQNQGGSIDDLAAEIPFGNEVLRQNLALNYFNREQYENAKKIVRDIKKSTFAEILSQKIIDATEIRQLQTVDASPIETPNISVTMGNNPAESIKVQLNALIEAGDWASLESIGEEAVESFPTQPYFYYAYGLALNKNGKFKSAITILGAAFDFLTGDTDLENKVYKEMAAAYQGINDPVKANMYLRKVKPGF